MLDFLHVRMVLTILIKPKLHYQKSFRTAKVNYVYMVFPDRFYNFAELKHRAMIDYIKGKIVEITPTDLVLENNNIGYRILISLQTYEGLHEKQDAVVYIHHYLREDEELYYGFATKDERELFRLLISVSGIGASTARMMLSSLYSDEIRNAILAEDLNKIKSIKGIGTKSAQRLILELKDKIAKGGGTDNSALFPSASDTVTEEATTALVMLGFTKANVNKAVSAVLKEKPGAALDEIIKLALKRL